MLFHKKTTVIDFYSDHRPDHKDRSLSEILQQDDDWLEYTHDYIQWLFPNKEPSRVNSKAPLIAEETIEAFQNAPVLQERLSSSFHRMLKFYGLISTEIGIQTGDNWDTRKGNWFLRDTHNNLRITRILICLMTLGLRSKAIEFYDGLVMLSKDEDCGISDEAYEFWEEAISRLNAP